ncbi:fluoride efflux transporter CrcB [Marinoscillum sp. MHG1-6]|uniref:fluoride efflux transporter CrcB n=1 Tax=Marinoscillum sp. MHG1-6 TaxID=2959627 RepID=UPI002156FA32|nr:fluoride efflux transporter CrcB [Marinoscillum sp. MHG1-6]
MKEVILAGIGGFVGSALRYLVGLSAGKLFHDGFPSGTLTVNLIGSLIIGLLAGYFLKYYNSNLSMLLITGFCGGFTTFSAFSLDILRLYQTQHYTQLSLYLIASVIGGLLLCFLGLFISNKSAL